MDSDNLTCQPTGHYAFHNAIHRCAFCHCFKLGTHLNNCAAYESIPCNFVFHKHVFGLENVIQKVAGMIKRPH